jgi:hypothetical protein
MKNFIVLGFVLISFIAKAQDTQEAEKVSVEKSLFGVQIGLVNASFQYEIKLDRKFTLLTEAVLALTTARIDYEDPAIKDESSTLIVPYITLEPRWYYGLDRRKRLGKKPITTLQIIFHWQLLICLTTLH